MSKEKIVQPDARGRITLGVEYADKWFKVEEGSEGSVRLIPVEWKKAKD